MKAKVFTVHEGEVTTGARVEAYTLPSEEVVPAILIGRADDAGFLQIENCPLSDGTGYIHFADVDAASSKLVAHSSEVDGDEESALVVFSVDNSERCTLMRGDVEAPPKRQSEGSIPSLWRSGRVSAHNHSGALSWCRVPALAGRGPVQFVHLLRKGEIFSALQMVTVMDAVTKKPRRQPPSVWFCTWDGKDLHWTNEKPADP